MQYRIFAGICRYRQVVQTKISFRWRQRKVRAHAFAERHYDLRGLREFDSFKLVVAFEEGSRGRGTHGHRAKYSKSPKDSVHPDQLALKDMRNKIVKDRKCIAKDVEQPQPIVFFKVREKPRPTFAAADMQPQPIVFVKVREKPRPTFAAADNAMRPNTSKNPQDHPDEGKPDLEVRKILLSAADDKPAEVFTNVGSRK